MLSISKTYIATSVDVSQNFCDSGCTAGSGGGKKHEKNTVDYKAFFKKGIIKHLDNSYTEKSETANKENDGNNVNSLDNTSHTLKR